MKRVCMLIFGLTILGLTSSGANADSYYGNYDSSRSYNGYYDSDRNRDSRGYFDNSSYEPHGSYNASQVYGKTYDNNDSIASLQLRAYDPNYRDQNNDFYDERRNFEMYREDQERQRREAEAKNQRQYGMFLRDQEQRRLENEAAMRENQRQFEEWKSAQERERLNQMENLGKQFEIFLKSQEQNGLPLSPEQQRERKIQQMQLINSIQEKIRNEELRQREEKERELEKINRIIPLKWHTKRKIEFLVDQLSEINSRTKNLIQNMQDHGISNDPNLEFVQRSIEFCCKGIQNFLLNGMQESPERSISSRINTIYDNKTLTNDEDDLFRRQAISRNSQYNRTNTQELPEKRVSRSFVPQATPAA